MEARSPSMKRSKARMDRILAAAADIISSSGDASALTTTSVAERADLAVTTVYRYFDDRDAILRALFERETEDLDARLITQFLGLETVTLTGLLDVMMQGFYGYFNSNDRAVTLWYGARQNPDVLARVQRRYAYMGEWFINGVRESGLASDEVPEFGGEAIVWLGDSMFAFMFREQRTEAERLEIMDEWLGMVRDRIAKYATPAGVAGISPADFIAKAGMFQPPGSSPVPPED